MINITFNDISISSASNNAGVFIGQNFHPQWDVFSKSNTNVSGNNVSDTINILIDKDGCDFTIHDKENAEQIIVKKYGHATNSTGDSSNSSHNSLDSIDTNENSNSSYLNSHSNIRINGVGLDEMKRKK